MTIMSIFGLWYGFAFAATVYAIVSDYLEARAEMRRARVQRPVMSLAPMRVVRR